MSGVSFYKTVFSEHDDSISLSLERDPLGLQPIWTTLGNNIFNGVTTSVATDIRNYTINLIHHLALFKIQQRGSFWTDLRINAKDETEESLKTRLLLAMEMMLAYSAVTEKWVNASGILGISSAKKRWAEPKNNNVIDLKALPKDPRNQKYDGFVTLLVRQSGLGINGRYKGPFKKMGLIEGGKYSPKINLNDIYKQLEEYHPLIESIVTFITKSISNNLELHLQPNETTCSAFIELYKTSFDKKPSISESTKVFWLSQLKIEDGSVAKCLYDGLREVDDVLLLASSLFTSQCNDSEQVKHICSVEPFLVMTEYLFAALLQGADQDLVYKVCQNIQKLIPNTELPENMSSRLHKLIDLAKLSIDEIPLSLVQYHEEISKEREIHPWITSQSGIRVFKKAQYIDNLQDKVGDVEQDLAKIKWRRDYYLASIKQIQSGFEVS